MHKMSVYLLKCTNKQTLNKLTENCKALISTTNSVHKVQIYFQKNVEIEKHKNYRPK